MKIIEQYIQSKTPRDDDCEDGIFANDHYVAIIDGATSKSSTLWNGKTPGKVATELILDQLTRIDGNVDAARFMQLLNTAVQEWYQAQGVSKQMRDTPVQRCSASVVAYSKAKHQLWFVGDCQARIDSQLFSPTKLIDTVTSNARALFLEAALLEGQTVADLQAHDTGRDYIRPLLEKQNLFQNIKHASAFGYTVIDGFFIDVHAITIIDVPATAKEIILASDGYPSVAATLAESERALHEVLAEDPLLIGRYKSMKGLQKGNLSYDDRAYIRFQIQ